ncbi:acetylornithine deacetylase [Halarchaeum rubridurum]|uniref:Acetylornithine deacetylase n=1 Tax=Halarchaeum rubridurum TaxID=489911 RepID=A0A830G1Q1_9EURY|nr:M20 family metallopeptidase [Halarchaeum rubridurum]MBP1955307.1 acetylornithine deacetylase [Halarchaeum rubridurum]GGM71196.1 peptidase M20 [Halarchaeum rubridurum]
MSVDPADFLERAVEIPSHEDVDAMRELLVAELADAGVEARVDDAGNTLARTAGAREGPHVVLNTHIDTVPPHVPPKRDGDVLRGRGSCDAKGPLAVLLSAFLDTEPARGTLTLAVTPDEETESTGADALDLDADCYVVGEPTELDACTAARGRFQGTVTLSGTAAHAAEPESGVSAIQGAAAALRAVEMYDDERGPDTHPSLGAPTLTATTIEGGGATNQIPADCSFVIDRRSVPPETANGFFAGLREHLRAAVPDAVGVEVEPQERTTPFLEAFATPHDSDVVCALCGAGAGDPRPFGAATEASYFADDAPTVVFGPGYLADDEGAVAHAEREYVDLPEVEAGARIVTDALDDLLA